MKLIYWTTYYIIAFLSCNCYGQNIIQYDSLNPKCNLIKYEWLNKKDLTYPITGNYSPTMHATNRAYSGTGMSSYIYFDIDQKMQPGVPYVLNISLKVFDSFSLSNFFNSHLGIAFSNTMPKDEDYSLWEHSFTHLKPKNIDTISDLSYNIRFLCKPKYAVIGVFNDAKTHDSQDNFAALYKYQIHKLHITKSEPTDSFIYVCNEFEEEKAKIEAKTAWRDTSIYFAQGSFDIEKKYDSIFADISKMNLDKQDLIYLDAFTNKSGSDNVLLGRQRNIAVLAKLNEIGIDTARIIMTNHDEQKASTEKGEIDRRVSINISNDKLYQKYYISYRQQLGKNVDLAKKNMNKWLAHVPPKNAIFALFDCYNEESNTDELRRYLYKKIVDKFYKNNHLKFELDSIWCEDQKIRTLEMYIRQNHLSTDFVTCEFQQNDNDVNILDSIAVALYEKYNFPELKKYGKRAYTTIPYIIIHSKNIALQEKFLPLFLKGAEQKKISWDLYATLYDKLAVKKTGLQRYGTQFMINLKLHPFEDETKVKEYRRRVGMEPLSDK